MISLIIVIHQPEQWQTYDLWPTYVCFSWWITLSFSHISFLKSWPRSMIFGWNHQVLPRYDRPSSLHGSLEVLMIALVENRWFFSMVSFVCTKDLGCFCHDVSRISWPQIHIDSNRFMVLQWYTGTKCQVILSYNILIWAWWSFSWDPDVPQPIL